jgi:hypothetical protein
VVRSWADGGSLGKGDAVGERGGIGGVVGFGGSGEAVCEGEELFKAWCAGGHERSGVQYDVVGDANFIGVGDEASIRTVAWQRGAKIESDEAKVVLSLSSSVVHDDEGATGCDGVGQEVVGFAKNTMSYGDGGKVGVGT